MKNESSDFSSTERPSVYWSYYPIYYFILFAFLFLIIFYETLPADSNEFVWGEVKWGFIFVLLSFGSYLILFFVTTDKLGNEWPETQSVKGAMIGAMKAMIIFCAIEYLVALTDSSVVSFPIALLNFVALPVLALLGWRNSRNKCPPKKTECA